MFVRSANNHASCVDYRVEIRVAATCRTHWAGRGLAIGLGPGPGDSFLGVAHQGWAGVARTWCALHRCGPLEAGWHQLSALQRLKAQASWRWRTQGLLHSTALSLWPVVLVLLTSLLGIAEWFTAPTYGDGIECDGWHLLLD
jgi:hypothetical protein